MGTQIRTQKQKGFTIIELILVLGVTSVMIVTFLVGMNSTIDTQRYRDSVVTFRNTIQSEYDKLNSVRNERDNTWSCNGNAITSQASGTITSRGQSGCQMMGRLITINNSDVTTHAILGYSATPADSKKADLAILRDDYQYSSMSDMKETSTLEWNTTIAYAKTGVDSRTPQSGRQISILLLRSPQSGKIYTFTDNKFITTPNASSLRSLLEVGNTVPGQGQRVVCLASGGLARSDMAVYIAARAASGTAVETRTNESMEGLSEC